MTDDLDADYRKEVEEFVQGLEGTYDFEQIVQQIMHRDHAQRRVAFEGAAEAANRLGQIEARDWCLFHVRQQVREEETNTSPGGS